MERMHGKKKELENARKEAFLAEDYEKENPTTSDQTTEGDKEADR